MEADWLILARACGQRPERGLRLLETFGSIGAIRQAGREALRSAGATPAQAEALREPDQEGLDRDLRWLAQRPDHHLLHRDHSAYPARLREIDDPPLALFVVGDPDVLSLPQLAVVGSRNATSGGVTNAREFSRHLAGYGLTITSGLAHGIDTAAHSGALDGGGYTVAVTATGPDRIYPAANRDLARRIVDSGGAVVTEYPCATPARPHHFPRRNRIISGLAAGTLVVEASPRSGSLITARLALEQGREVFALPGSIHNPLARGCHRLIRDGVAKLTEQCRDILEELAGRLPPVPDGASPATAGSADGPAEADAAMDPDHAATLDAVAHDPVPLDVIVQRTGLTADTVSSILLQLELSGFITAMPGGRYVRAG